MTIKKTMETLDANVKTLQENMVLLEKRQDQQDKMMEMMHSLLSNQKMTIEMLVSLSKPSISQEQQSNKNIQTSSSQNDIQLENNVHDTNSSKSFNKHNKEFSMNRRIMV